MHERAAREAAQQQQAFDQYVRQTAGTSGDTTADQLAKLADLKSQGVLSEDEFQAQKAKILAS
jgi:hypothetical protein